jgi:hypothetical protein
MPLIAEATTIGGPVRQRLTMFAAALNAGPSSRDVPPNFITVTWLAKSFSGRLTTELLIKLEFQAKVTEISADGSS